MRIPGGSSGTNQSGAALDQFMTVGDHNSRLMIKANNVPDIKKPIKQHILKEIFITRQKLKVYENSYSFNYDF